MLEKSSLLLSEIYQEWRFIRRQEVKPSTYTVEEQGLVSFYEQFKDAEIQKITNRQIQHLLLSSGLAPSTQRLRKYYIKRFFDYSVSAGYISENPVDTVVLPRVRETVEKVNEARHNFLSKEEMHQVLALLAQSEDSKIRERLIIEFLFLTGLRIGELLALQYADIEGEELHVRHTLNYHSRSERERCLQSPKTAYSFRTVFLNKRSQEIIAYFREHRTDEQFVFVDEQGQTFYRIHLNRYFCWASQKALGDKSRHYSLHILRHSHISLLVELEVPIKVIMERVGHKDEKVTLQIYTHLTEQSKKKVIEKLDDLEL